MRFLLRSLMRLATGLAIVLVLCGGLATGMVWLTIPSDHTTVRISGMDGPVSITLDADGVPRIHAMSERDGATALGFLHARERMFQMDLMRRAASGRLSEIAGSSTLRLDRMMRTLGLRRRAIEDLATLPVDTTAMLEAYARGVNAWIESRGRFSGLEFLFLGTPERWQPVDSLLWAKTMGLWLSMNWRQELARRAIAAKVSPTLLDQLWPRQDHVAPVDARVSPQQAQKAAQLASVLPNFPDPFTMPQTASNEWAVDGRWTASGAPLLAGDPHLAFSFPGIWYLARVETPVGLLVGATSPGVPFLVLGHNGRIAWTFTTTGADVQDVFVESAVGRTAYETPNGPRPFILHEERIGVRGEPDHVMTVRETRHGPVISDIDAPEGPILAVAMGNLQAGDTAATGLLALNRASTVQQAQSAAGQITSPVQNLMVADRSTIAMFVTGRVPIRKAGDGAAPVPGDGSHDWVGWASGDGLPHVVSPARGRLVNANEPVVMRGSQAFMGRDGFGPWRAERIRQMLDQSGPKTAAGFAGMQVETTNMFARRVLPQLLALPNVVGEAQTALKLLRSWDGTASMNQPQPLIFHAWMSAFYHNVLTQSGLTGGLGAPVADFVSFVLSPDGTQWCRGDCDDLLRESLTTAMINLRQRFGDDLAGWRWGEAHRATFAHPLLRTIPLLETLGTVSIPSPGDDDTVGRGGFDASFRSVHGASYRGVYDLADLEQSLFIMAPGQSGHIFSAHAWDFLARWRNGATIFIGPDAGEEKGRIQLLP